MLIKPNTMIESELKFKTIYDQNLIGISIGTKDGKLIGVNQKLCEMTGFSKKELTDRKFQDITHTDDLKKNLELFTNLVKGEIESFKIEKRYIRKDKKIIIVELEARVVRNEKGGSQYILAVVNDITKKKNAKNELKESYRQLKEMNLKLESIREILKSMMN